MAKAIMIARPYQKQFKPATMQLGGQAYELRLSTTKMFNSFVCVCMYVCIFV